MAVAFEQFILMIKDFDSITKKTISHCKSITNLCTVMGDVACQQVNDAVNKKKEYKKKEGSLTFRSDLTMTAADIVIESIIGGIAKSIADSINEAKINSAKNAILELGSKHMEKYNKLFPILQEACEYQIDARLKIINEERKNIEALLLSDKKVDSKKGLEIIQTYINIIYKMKYRMQLGQRLGVYFENYVQKLADLNEFSLWVNSEVLINEKEFYETIVSDFSSEILKFTVNTPKKEKFLCKMWRKISKSRPKLSIKETDFLSTYV